MGRERLNKPGEQKCDCGLHAVAQYEAPGPDGPFYTCDAEAAALACRIFGKCDENCECDCAAKSKEVSREGRTAK